MLKYIYKLILTNIFFIKSLYKTKTRETSSNSLILSVTLVIINLHSLLVVLDYFHLLNIGLTTFWRPTTTPKSGFGYLLGFVIIILYFFIIRYVESSLPKGLKYSIKRKVVAKGRNLVGSTVYVVFTIILFLASIFMLADLIFSH